MLTSIFPLIVYGLGLLFPCARTLFPLPPGTNPGRSQGVWRIESVQSVLALLIASVGIGIVANCWWDRPKNGRGWDGVMSSWE
jgi:hypothetical protein